MNANLDKIAQELYGKIQTRFSDIKIGDEHAEVLSKKEDIPKARFFEFEYEEDGESLGTIAITLDADDGIVVQVSGDLVNDRDSTTHHGAYKFIRSFRQFAKDRLLNFDIQNIGKSNLDKRDYTFQAKRKEEPVMAQQPVMENKMYGNARMSYQDLGEARLVVKHTQPINLEMAAGRTQHIDAIYIENAQGERFRYPYKHLNGARALAEHIKAGGNPYDSIGKHICSLSEELASLRKFKGYVSRQEQVSEAMGSVTDRVLERIDTIKETIHKLQRPAYYQAFVESFEEQEEQMIPEEIQNDLIDRLTIRTFNEELKAVFPYIYKFVDESELPVIELGVADILGEQATGGQDLGDGFVLTSIDAFGEQRPAILDTQSNTYLILNQGKDGSAIARTPAKYLTIKDGKTGASMGGPATNAAFAKAGLSGQPAAAQPTPAQPADPAQPAGPTAPTVAPEPAPAPAPLAGSTNTLKNNVTASGATTRGLGKPTMEDQYEAFMNDIVREDKDEVFSPNPDASRSAIDKLNDLMSAEIKGGPEGINAIESLKGLIDDPEFVNSLRDINPDLDVRPLVQQFLQQRDPDVAAQLEIGDDSVGGADVAVDSAPTDVATADPTAPTDVATADPTAAAPAETPVGPEVAMREAKDEDNSPPWDVDPKDKKSKPTTPGKHGQGYSQARHLARQGLQSALKKAKETGATLETQMDFGDKVMTIAEVLECCGMQPQEVGFDQEGGLPAMLKYISGFYNTAQGNFPLGGMRVKIKVKKAFEDGEFGNAQPEDLMKVIKFIDMKDPSGDVHGQEQSHVLKLAGVGHSPEVTQDECMTAPSTAGSMPSFDVSTIESQLASVQESKGYDEVQRLISLVHFR